jgi:hypothetical protein
MADADLLHSLEQELAALAARRAQQHPKRSKQHPSKQDDDVLFIVDVDASSPGGAGDAPACRPGMSAHGDVRGSVELHDGSPSPAFTLPGLGLGHLACLRSSLQQGGSGRHRRAWSADEQREALQRHQVDVLAAQLFQEQPGGLEEGHADACSSPASCSSSSASTLASLPESPLSPAAAEAQEGGAAPGAGARRGHRRVRSMHHVLDILTQEQLMLGQQGEPRHLLLPAAGGERSPKAAAAAAAARRLPPLRRPSALLGATQAPGAAGEAAAGMLCS